MEKTSWTDAEKKVLALITQNKEQFYRYTRKEWMSPFFSPRSGKAGCSTTGYQSVILSTYLTRNPNRGTKLLALARAIEIGLQLNSAWWGMSNPEALRFLEKLYEKYRERIERKTAVVDPFEIGNYLALPPSQEVRHLALLEELLSRGFIPHTELKPTKGKWVIRAPFKLRFHRDFDNKPDAMLVYSKFALVQYCTITQYKLGLIYAIPKNAQSGSKKTPSGIKKWKSNPAGHRGDRPNI